MLVNEAGIEKPCDEDEESEAIAPLNVLIFASIGEVEDSGDQERMINDDEDHDGGAVDSRLILGIDRPNFGLEMKIAVGVGNF